jgi:hypothetical protein
MGVALTRDRIIILALVLVFLVFVVGWTTGACSSEPLPPKPTEDEMALVRATHFDTTVAVLPTNPPIYGESFTEILQRTELFNGVGTLEQFPDAGLTVRVEGSGAGTATIPIFTFISGGLIPTIVEETWGTLFSLAPNTLPEGAGLAPSTPVLLHQPNHQVRGQGPVVVDFVYGGDTILGWASIIYNLSPDRTREDPEETERFRDTLSLEIVRHADGIQRLIENR